MAVRQPKVIIGGPSYCLQTDARHTGAVALLAAALAHSGVKTIAMRYKHGTPVDIPRNELFHDALKSDFDVLVWLDSDTFIVESDIKEWCKLVLNVFRKNHVYVGVATPQRDGRINVWTGEKIGERMRPSDKAFSQSELFPVHAMGLGCGIFNLPKFRSNWGAGPWFCSRHMFDQTPIGFESEDYFFTTHIRKMFKHTEPLCTPLFLCKHVHRGGHS